MQVRFGSPESFLARFYSHREDQSILILLTGPSGAGKTFWCQAMASLAREQGVLLGGLISPPVFIDAHQIAIDLLAVASGERHRLAHSHKFCQKGQAANDTVLSTETWCFDADVLEWGNQMLEQSANCDLFLLDEIGPLEFERGNGFQAGLLQLDARRHPLSIVVVRPALIAKARARWPWGQIIRVASAREAWQV